MLIEQTLSLFENGQYEEGKQKLVEVMETSNDHQIFDLANHLAQLGFIEEAKNLFEHLLKMYPDEGEIIIALSDVLIDLDEIDQAILLLEQITEENEFYPQSLFVLADLYSLEGLYDVGRNKLLVAKSLLPNEPVIDFALAELYVLEGEDQKAIEHYKNVLIETESINGIDVHQRIAEALSAIGSFEDALHHYDHALKHKLEINTLFAYGLTAFQAGHFKTAIKSFTDVIELDHEYYSVYLYLAKAYEQENLLNDCFHTIKEGIRRDEYNKDFYLYGGKIALKMGEEKEAEELLSQSLAIDPSFVEAGILLNKLFIKQERYENVLEIISEFERVGEEDPQFHWDKAICFHHLEKYSDALNEYLLAYNVFKNDQEFLIDYGYFLVEEGKQGDAVEVFKQLIKEDPTNEEWLEMIQRLSEESY